MDGNTGYLSLYHDNTSTYDKIQIAVNTISKSPIAVRDTYPLHAVHMAVIKPYV